MSDQGAVRRRARAKIDSPADRVLPAIPASGRRLSSDERERYRQRAKAKAGDAPAGRAVPKLPAVDREKTVRSKGMVALGAALILALTVLAFAGGKLFGSPKGASPPAAVAPAPATPLVDLDDPMAAPAATMGPGQGGSAPPPPLAADNGPRQPIICLDPGHGGQDRGFTRGQFGSLESVEEAVLVMRQAQDLQARLTDRGYTVVMTRTTDASPNADVQDINGDGKTSADDVPGNRRFEMLDDIQARINICNDADADLLVSMHINGYTTQKPFGYETWFTRERPFGNRSATFATLAYAHLKEQFRKLGYELKPEDERGVNPDTAANVVMDHSLFKHFIITGPEVPGSVDPSRMPGAIVETLFVSNDGDASILISPDGENAIVTAYENAIVEYFERYPVDADE